MNQLIYEAKKQADVVQLLRREGLFGLIPDIEKLITDVLKSDKRYLVIDLTDVIMIDSSFLNFLIRANTQAKQENKQMILVSPNPSVNFMFKISQTDQLFDIYSSIDNLVVV